MRRILIRRVVLALIATVLIASCGRTSAPTSEPSSEIAPSGSTAASPPPPPPNLDSPAMLEWSGKAPVWSLGFAETADALLARYYPDRAELPAACLRDAEKVREACLRTFFSERGVSDAALDLLFAHDISVFGVEGDGPVQVAWVWDWTNLGWNYYNANYIFTPQGILKELERSTWDAYRDALATAGETETFARINEALPELGGVGFSAWGGQDSYFGAPEETPTGWTVPFTMRISGCHACITQFAGRFAFDFTADGAAEDAHFVDFCVYPYDPEADRSEAVTALEDELPVCSSNTPYDGSVKASDDYPF